MYLLDTDILIWLLRGNKQIIEKVLLMKDEAELCISVISVAEIYKNIFPSEIPTTETFLSQHIIFDINAAIAKQAGLYWQQYSKSLRNLSLADCFIAATVNTHNLTLVSLNIKHFPMHNINKINPLG